MTFKKGQKVKRALTGAGYTTYEDGVILDVDEKGVWLDNGAGNDPAGPFHPETGEYLEYSMPGFSSKIELI